MFIPRRSICLTRLRTAEAIEAKRERERKEIYICY